MSEIKFKIAVLIDGDNAEAIAICIVRGDCRATLAMTKRSK